MALFCYPAIQYLSTIAHLSQAPYPARRDCSIGHSLPVPMQLLVGSTVRMDNRKRSSFLDLEKQGV